MKPLNFLRDWFLAIFYWWTRVGCVLIKTLESQGVLDVGSITFLIPDLLTQTVFQPGFCLLCRSPPSTECCVTWPRRRSSRRPRRARASTTSWGCSTDRRRAGHGTRAPRPPWVCPPHPPPPSARSPARTSRSEVGTAPLFIIVLVYSVFTRRPVAHECL